MAYFQRKRADEEEQYTRKFRTIQQESIRTEEAEAEAEEEYYDDGLDALNWEEEEQDGALPEEEAEEEWTEEELAEERKRKFRIAAGVGDLAAILAGTAVILVLAALLISMIRFVSSDITQNFTIWATKF